MGSFKLLIHYYYNHILSNKFNSKIAMFKFLIMTVVLMTIVQQSTACLNWEAVWQDDDLLERCLEFDSKYFTDDQLSCHNIMGDNGCEEKIENIPDWCSDFDLQLVCAKA